MAQDGIRPNSLDHVALWVEDRDELAAFACGHLGMHEIERTEKFTLVGSDARRGKLTLFAAEGPRTPGALERVVLRVSNLGAAVNNLPEGVEVHEHDGESRFQAPQGLGVALREADTEVEYDLDHVVLRVREPESSSEAFTGLGFERKNGTLAVADKHVQLKPGGEPEGTRPLLNHIALLVDSADEVQRAAEERGLEVADVVDAPNTLAVFVWGPDRIKLEYVEHKPGFSLV